MKLLLDTHVVIWLATQPDRVPENIRSLIVSTQDVLVSAISGWEYGLKRTKYADELPRSFDEILAPSQIQTCDFPFACHRYAEDLPLIHRDPFDRMLIAHALIRGAALVTADKMIAQYPVDIIW